MTSLACNMNLPPELRLGQPVLTAGHDNQAQTLVPLMEALGDGDPESTEGRPPRGRPSVSSTDVERH